MRGNFAEVAITPGEKPYFDAQQVIEASTEQHPAWVTVVADVASEPGDGHQCIMHGSPPSGDPRFAGKVDGVYGPFTARSLRLFQQVVPTSWVRRVDR